MNIEARCVACNTTMIEGTPTGVITQVQFRLTGAGVGQGNVSLGINGAVNMNVGALYTISVTEIPETAPE